jgi:hypothetical protein
MSVPGAWRLYAQGGKGLAFLWLLTRGAVTPVCPAFARRGEILIDQTRHTRAE